MKSLNELKQLIETLCFYNYDDEAEDYDECRKGSGNENGIFPVVVELLNFVHGTHDTADSICDNLFGPVEQDDEILR